MIASCTLVATSRSVPFLVDSSAIALSFELMFFAEDDASSILACLSSSRISWEHVGQVLFSSKNFVSLTSFLISDLSSCSCSLSVDCFELSLASVSDTFGVLDSMNDPSSVFSSVSLVCSSSSFVISSLILSAYSLLRALTSLIYFF